MKAEEIQKLKDECASKDQKITCLENEKEIFQKEQLLDRKRIGALITWIKAEQVIWVGINSIIAFGGILLVIIYALNLGYYKESLEKLFLHGFLDLGLTFLVGLGTFHVYGYFERRHEDRYKPKPAPPMDEPINSIIYMSKEKYLALQQDWRKVVTENQHLIVKNDDLSLQLKASMEKPVLALPAPVETMLITAQARPSTQENQHIQLPAVTEIATGAQPMTN